MKDVSSFGTIQSTDRCRSQLCATRVRQPELLLFGLLVAIFSGPVIGGSFAHSMIFQVTAVRNGEWWRWFTHPFVHVTWYHLLLDGAAFFLLYPSLRETRIVGRLAYVIAGGMGSLLTSLAAAPLIATARLCGLSGIAHGLMAVSALEMMAGQSRRSTSTEWWIGLFTFLTVAGKAAIEALTGRVFFGFLHFGLMGDPVAVSHAGGVVGGLLAMLMLGRGHLSIPRSGAPTADPADGRFSATRAQPVTLQRSAGQ